MAQEIQPHKVTKPIQLLAAWLLGLIAVDGAFLTAANVLPNPPWAAGVLVIAAVINVPVFLALVLSFLIGIVLWIVHYVSFERKVWTGPK